MTASNSGPGIPRQQVPGFRQGDLRKLGIPIKRVHDDKPAGAVTVTVEYAKAGDNRYTLISEDRKTTHMLGTPIEELRKQFGGNRGHVTDPWGKHHEIELAAHMPNGKGIYVIVNFRFVKAGMQAN
ncbi:MAG TPA: hypothetical protein VKV38_11060 [Trebonia sp.]|jgi:hypothetical protein|nr:hypothetical protein [Trebonia sp.]